MVSFSFGQAYKPTVPTKIKCKLKKTAYFITKDGIINVDVEEEKNSFIISGLDSDTPKIKISDGWESRLYVLQRNKEAIYLAEVTGAGFVIYISLLLKQKVVTFVKSYPITDSASMCYMSYGHFE
jgi:hypothetical protein